MSQTIAPPPPFERPATGALRRGPVDRSWRGHVILVIAELVVSAGLIVLAATSDLSTVGRLAAVLLAVLFTVTLATLVTRESDVSRGSAALVGGIVGVTFGGGIGPVWLVTSGLSVVALLSLAALAAGLLLLASGAWLLIRATPGWWRLAAIPVAFLILQFVLLPLAGAAYGTHPPRTPLSATRPAGARGVSFGTPDGVTLEAWYTPSRNGAVIILLPGSGGDKGSTVAHAAVLVEHGYGVLALDSRGTGESGGSGNAWGWHGTSDVAGAMAWLREQPEVDHGRIGALGLSMGGEVAVTAAASEAGLAAVVAEGISARVPADLAYLPDDVSGVIQRLDGEIMWAVADLMTDAVMPMPLPEAVTAVGVPTLIIVGASADERAAAPILTAAAPALQVWDLPETPHILSLERHPDEWKTRVSGFLDESLAP